MKTPPKCGSARVSMQRRRFNDSSAQVLRVASLTDENQSARPFAICARCIRDAIPNTQRDPITQIPESPPVEVELLPLGSDDEPKVKAAQASDRPREPRFRDGGSRGSLHSCLPSEPIRDFRRTFRRVSSTKASSHSFGDFTHVLYPENGGRRDVQAVHRGRPGLIL